MLEEEFLHAMDGLDERSSAWLMGQDVPEIALHIWPGPIGVASIKTHPLGFFDLSEQGRRAFIHPVLSGPAFTDIVDLIAWYPEVPGRWRTRSHTGVPLGVDQLDRAELLGEPLRLHPTPLSWLQARGAGVCIIDFKMSASALHRVPALVFENPEFGQSVRQMLAMPPLAVPEIRVLKKEAA